MVVYFVCLFVHGLFFVCAFISFVHWPHRSTGIIRSNLLIIKLGSNFLLSFCFLMRNARDNWQFCLFVRSAKKRFHFSWKNSFHIHAKYIRNSFVLSLLILFSYRIIFIVATVLIVCRLVWAFGLLFNWCCLVCCVSFCLRSFFFHAQTHVHSYMYLYRYNGMEQSKHNNCMYVVVVVGRRICCRCRLITLNWFKLVQQV